MAPAPWAEPLTDYHAAGRAHVGPMGMFMEGVHDLATYDDRLYFGYGDATVNLGRVTPIEVRSFSSDTATIARSEFTTGEEQLEHFRRLSDGLYIPGEDAVEDALLGNLYLRTDTSTGWAKRRTLTGGVHVHDVAEFEGRLFAVGSGANDLAEWNAGRVFGYLWSSIDGGDSFDVVHRNPNGGVGDSRWTRMLPVGQLLYLFGFQTSQMGSINRLPNRIYNGLFVDELGAGHALEPLLIIETDPINEQIGFIRGIDAMVQPLRYGLWTIDENGAVERVTEFDGKTVVDVFNSEESGETLILTVEGDEWRPMRNTWRMEVWATSDVSAYAPVLAFESDIAVSALAHWRGDLYFANERGVVLRAAKR